MAERITVTINGTAYAVEIDNLDSAGGAPLAVRVNGRAYSVQLGERPVQAVAAPKQEPPAAATAPETKPAPKKPAADVAAGDGKGERVVAPMPGKILSVAVKAGDQVKYKDTLCTLEAMKMEMSIAAPADGTVRDVRAQVGDTVVYGDLLFVID